jgi:hypothetical protein
MFQKLDLLNNNCQQETINDNDANKKSFICYWKRLFKDYKFSYILVHHARHGINNTAHKNNNALKKCMIK